MTPPPVHAPTRLKFQREQYGDKATGRLERTTERAGMYAKAAERIAKANDVLFLDLWSAMLGMGDDHWPKFVGAGRAGGDGLHLSLEGQQFVANNLIALLEKETTPAEDLPQEFPWGRDINRAQYQTDVNAYQRNTEQAKVGQGREFIISSVPSYASGSMGYTFYSLGTVSLAAVLFGMLRLLTSSYRRIGPPPTGGAKPHY